MITPRPDRSATREIPAVHAAIAGLKALQRERRALYQLAAELLEPGMPHILDLDVIDSPLARHHIGDAMAGRTSLSSSTLVSISALATTNGGAHDLRIASRPEASTLLAGALEIIGTELGGQHAAAGSPELLTEADGERFTSALALCGDGVALARSVSPDLVEDLLPHVALVGIIDPQRARRLVSASPRTFPGLILLKIPRSSIEVAEALVHEGAHQKLFDLAITHDLLNTNSDQCPPFHPPWAPEGRLWPLEQTLAACHAYACLARFAHDLTLVGRAHRLGAESLLSVAGERSEIIGEWLLERGDHLGTDAHILLDGLIGQRPRTTRTSEKWSGQMPGDYVIGDRLAFRRCGSPDRVLVGCLSKPPRLFWVSDDAAALLELLGQRSADELIHTFAQRWGVQTSDAADRLAVLLADLYVSGVVRLRDTAGGSR